MIVRLVFVLGVLAVDPAHAAEEGTEGGGYGLLALQILNTAILVLILVRYARQPLRGFLHQRRHEIIRAIEGAEQRLRASRDELEAAERRLERLDEAAEEIVRSAIEQAEVERDRTLVRAEATAERIRESARAAADHELERARQELRAEAAELATSLAGDLLRDHLGDEDDRRLVREYTERIGGSS